MGVRITARVRELPQSWGHRITASACWQQIGQSKPISAKFSQRRRAPKLFHQTFCQKYAIRPLDRFFFHATPISTLLLCCRNQGQSERGAQKIFLLSATWRRAKRPAGADREQLRRCSRESTHQHTAGSPTHLPECHYVCVRVCEFVRQCVCVRLVSTHWQQSQCRTWSSTDGEQFNKTIILISRHRQTVSHGMKQNRKILKFTNRWSQHSASIFSISAKKIEIDPQGWCLDADWQFCVTLFLTFSNGLI